MDDAEARAILRQHGEEPPLRGRLNDEWKARATHYADQDAAAPDYDGGVTEADFPPDGEPTGPEQPPRRPKTTRTPLAERLRGQRHKGKGKPRRKHPRVPVDRVVGLVWEALGRMFTPLSPPVGRCLQLQAPVAGLVLEDVVKDTVADRILQPVARAEEKGKKVLAVAGPPMLVLAIEQAQTLPEAQAQARLAFLIPMLRESLVLWGEVAGDKLEEQIARTQARGPAYDRADELMALIFGGDGAQPQPASSPEDDAAAHAQRMAGV